LNNKNKTLKQNIPNLENRQSFKSFRNCSFFLTYTQPPNLKTPSFLQFLPDLMKKIIKDWIFRGLRPFNMTNFDNTPYRTRYNASLLPLALWFE